MIKTCVFALLVVSVFTAKLTPGTRLPNPIDDMIHNNLGSVESFNDESEAVHKVSKDIGQTKSAELLTFLTSELPWANIKSLNTIIQRALKVDEYRVESHYIFQSFVQLGEFRYAMVNLVKTKDNFKVVVSYEFKQAFGIHKDTIYHDVRSSLFGLPFDSETILFNEDGDKQEFHEFNKNRLLADLKSIRGTQKTELLGAFDVDATVKSATGAVKGLTDCWQSIVTAFKTVDNETLKKTITGQGYTQFQKASRFLRTLGVPTAQYATVKPAIMTLLGMNKNPMRAKELDAAIVLAQWSSQTDWGASEFTFDIDTKGNCNSAFTLSKGDLTNQMFSVISVVIDASFQLAPNILIYEKFRSVAGGIVESTKTIRKEVPRSLTDKDIKALNSVVLLSTLETMSKNFGVAWRLPGTVFNK
jgi:hypothetical protein